MQTPLKMIDQRSVRSFEALAAHDKWFREQVRLAIDDPRPGIPHGQLKADMAKRKSMLHKALPATGPR